MGFSDFVLNCSKTEMSEKRHVLFEQINGDMFYNISSWPRDMESLFWRKPTGDQQAFHLLPFLVENGCPPWLVELLLFTRNPSLLVLKIYGKANFLKMLIDVHHDNLRTVLLQTPNTSHSYPF